MLHSIGNDSKNWFTINRKRYVLISTSKAAGIDRLPGIFLTDGANVLAKPITDICNLSVSSK